MVDPFVSVGVQIAYRRGVELWREWKKLRDEFTPQKREELLQAIEDGAGGPKTLRAQAELQYYLTAFQVNSSERGARQLAIGTYILALATVGLVVATIVLVVVSAKNGG